MPICTRNSSARCWSRRSASSRGSSSPSSLASRRLRRTSSPHRRLAATATRRVASHHKESTHMAIVEVKVPQLSESVAEATLLHWKKKPGEAVAMDEILVEIETDKVVLEVPAPAAGVMAQLVKNDGESCVGEEVIAKIDTEGTAKSSPLDVKAIPAATRTRPAGPASTSASVAMPAAAKLMADNQLSAGARAGHGQGRPHHQGRCVGRARRGSASGAQRSGGHRQHAGTGQGAGRGGRARCGAARRPPRAARAHEPAAGPGGRTPAAIAGDQRDPDHLQRGQHGARDGNAQAFPGEVREGARRQDRLHEFLREGRGGRAEEVPCDQRVSVDGN